MATMNVSLPNSMKEWVEAQARTGRYSNASDYVRDLIRRDQKRAEAFDALRQIIDEAEARGTSRSIDTLFADACQIARQRAHGAVAAVKGTSIV